MPPGRISAHLGPQNSKTRQTSNIPDPTNISLYLSLSLSLYIYICVFFVWEGGGAELRCLMFVAIFGPQTGGNGPGRHLKRFLEAVAPS